MGPDSFQWCPAAGQGAAGMNLSIGSSSEHEEELLYFEGVQLLDQVAQRGGGFSFAGDIQDPPGQGPVQPAVGDPALAGGLD